MRLSGGRRTVLLILVGLTVLFGIAVGVTVGVAVASVRNIDEISRSADTELALPTILIDRNGREITQLFAAEKRTPVSIESLPRHVIYALVTREDRAFFQHGGFNLARIASAAVNIGLEFVTGDRAGYFSGGSTLTQQLAKMMYTDQSVTIRRKIVELWWALQLERHLTKYQILEEYLNRMPFGHGTYGIEAASRFYFNHSANELTVAEAVLLMLQLSSPGHQTYSPIANPENARGLQREILTQMVELGYATEDEADESFAAYWANHDYTRSANTGAFLERRERDPAPWFSEHVRIRLQDELLLGSANIYTDGYRVYTTLDLDYQREAQQRLWEGIQSANETYRLNQISREGRIDRYVPIVDMLAVGFDIEPLRVGSSRDEKRAAIQFRNQLAPILEMTSLMFDRTEQDTMRQVSREVFIQAQAVTQRTRVEGGLITIENETGHILAMVGGSPFEPGNQVNRAISAQRPPGSSFKPLYYAAGINNGTITAATAFNDSPVIFWNADGTPYSPRNFQGTWSGMTRVRHALATSMNIVSLKVLNAIGFSEALGTAGRLLGLNEAQMAQRGFESKFPVGLGTVSLSPLLMARAFATFANGGREVIPISIRYIEDRRGRVVMSPEQDVNRDLARKGQAAQIISPQAAYVMTNILESTVEYGTLRNRRLLVGGFDDMPMAGKTGTTQNWSDAWAVGYSPYMTTAVWIGFDRGGNNSLGTNQTGAQTAGPIWAWYMKAVHANLPVREFTRPPGIVELTVTADTGKLPTENYRGSTISEIFIAGTAPTQFDTQQEFHDDRRERIASSLARPTSLTSAAGIRDRVLAMDLISPIPTTTPDSVDGDRDIRVPDTGVNPFFTDDPFPDDDAVQDEESAPEGNPMLD